MNKAIIPIPLLIAKISIMLKIKITAPMIMIVLLLSKFFKSMFLISKSVSFSLIEVVFGVNFSPGSFKLILSKKLLWDFDSDVAG